MKANQKQKTAPTPVAAAPVAVSPISKASTPATEEKAKETEKPVDLATLDLKGVFEARAGFEALKSLGLASLVKLSKAGVKEDKRLKDQASGFRSNSKWWGKLLAAMQVEHAKAVDAKVLPQGKTFKAYHAENAEGDPNNHALSCASCWNDLVMTGRLDEVDYDSAATAWLEEASAIVKLVVKNGGDLDSPDVAEVVKILKARIIDTAAKNLRAIKARLKGESETSADGTPVVVEFTETNANAFLREIFARHWHGLVTAALKAEVLTAANLPPASIKGFYNATLDIGDAWEKSGVTVETLDQWSRERNHVEIKDAVAKPAAVITPPAPMPVAAPEIALAEIEEPEPATMEAAAHAWATENFGDLNAEEIAEVVPQVMAFITANASLPENAIKFEAFMQEVAA